jgi:hypothetical protein
VGDTAKVHGRPNVNDEAVEKQKKHRPAYTKRRLQGRQQNSGGNTISRGRLQFREPLIGDGAVNFVEPSANW